MKYSVSPQILHLLIVGTRSHPLGQVEQIVGPTDIRQLLQSVQKFIEHVIKIVFDLFQPREVFFSNILLL